MTPFDKTSPLAENTGVIMWGASKIRHTSASIHCPNANRFSGSPPARSRKTPPVRSAEISQYQDTLSPQTGCGKSTKERVQRLPVNVHRNILVAVIIDPRCSKQPQCCKNSTGSSQGNGNFSIFGSFTPLIIISSTGSHHVSIPCDLRCP